MGNMAGYRQVSLYVNPDLYARASHVAKMLNEPIYEFLNQALAAAIEQRATPEQRKAVDILVGAGSPSDEKKNKKGNTKAKKRK